jgi:hypothetical protein
MATMTRIEWQMAATHTLEAVAGSKENIFVLSDSA